MGKGTLQQQQQQKRNNKEIHEVWKLRFIISHVGVLFTALVSEPAIVHCKFPSTVDYIVNGFNTDHAAVVLVANFVLPRAESAPLLVYHFIITHFFRRFSPASTPDTLLLQIRQHIVQRIVAPDERCWVSVLRRTKRGAFLMKDERNERAKRIGWVSLVVDVAVCA
mgnify:CR=1 FL=1